MCNKVGLKNERPQKGEKGKKKRWLKISLGGTFLSDKIPHEINFLKPNLFKGGLIKQKQLFEKWFLRQGKKRFIREN